MIRPEDWQRMSWHARQRATLRLASDQQIVEELATRRTVVARATQPQRARIHKAHGCWYVEAGTVAVPFRTHPEAITYVRTAA